jgi:hypothetical protein
MSTYVLQAGMMADEAIAQGFKKIAILADSTNYGQLGRDVVDHRDLGFLVEALGGQGHAGVDEAEGGDHLLLRTTTTTTSSAPRPTTCCRPA